MVKKVFLGLVLGVCALGVSSSNAMFLDSTGRYGRDGAYGNHPTMLQECDPTCLCACLTCATGFVFLMAADCCRDAATEVGHIVGLSPRPVQDAPAAGAAMTETPKNK